MAETRVKKAHYLNTGTAESPVWTQINRGFTAFTQNLNPETESSQYIGEQNATEMVKKYSAQISYTYKVEKDATNTSYDPVVMKFFDIAKYQKLNEKMDILTVYLFDQETFDDDGTEITRPFAVRGYYNVIPDVEADSEPGEYLEGSGNLNQDGDLKFGYYTAPEGQQETGTFTEATPINPEES